MRFPPEFLCFWWKVRGGCWDDLFFEETEEFGELQDVSADGVCHNLVLRHTETPGAEG